MASFSSARTYSRDIRKSRTGLAGAPSVERLMASAALDRPRGRVRIQECRAWTGEARNRTRARRRGRQPSPARPAKRPKSTQPLGRRGEVIGARLIDTAVGMRRLSAATASMPTVSSRWINQGLTSARTAGCTACRSIAMRPKARSNVDLLGPAGIASPPVGQAEVGRAIRRSAAAVDPSRRDGASFPVERLELRRDAGDTRSRGRWDSSLSRGDSTGP